MSLPVILRPEADDDVQTSHDDLERVRAGLGDQFVARVREVLEQIESMPELFGVVWQDVRAVRLRQFKHVVYYVVFADRVEVLADARRARSVGVAISRLNSTNLPNQLL